MSADEESISDFLSRARSRRGREQEKNTETEIPHSEYDKVLLLCHSYFQAFMEGYQGQPMMIKRRNRIFQIIELIARFRKGLPTVKEYFEGREIGIFQDTIAEFEALEYVNVIQTKIMEMRDPKVEVGELDDDMSLDEEV